MAMNLFTIHRLAGLQKASAVVFLGMSLILVLCKYLEKPVSCDPIELIYRNHTFNATLELNCLNSSFYDPIEAPQIDLYNKNLEQLGYHLFLLAIGFTCLRLLWCIWKPSGVVTLNNLHNALNVSSFTCARTGIYLLLCFLYLIGEFNAFQHLLGDRFVNFAIIWFENVYNGKTTFAYDVTCVVVRRKTHIPFPPSFCHLQLNDAFEIVYLVLWFWFMLSAVINTLCLLQYLLLIASSKMRFIRLSELLRSLDRKIVEPLADDVDVFFKLETCSGSFKKVNHPNYATFSANNSPYQVIASS